MVSTRSASRAASLQPETTPANHPGSQTRANSRSASPVKAPATLATVASQRNRNYGGRAGQVVTMPHPPGDESFSSAFARQVTEADHRSTAARTVKSSTITTSSSSTFKPANEMHEQTPQGTSSIQNRRLRPVVTEMSEISEEQIVSFTSPHEKGASKHSSDSSQPKPTMARNSQRPKSNLSNELYADVISASRHASSPDEEIEEYDNPPFQIPTTMETFLRAAPGVARTLGWAFISLYLTTALLLGVISTFKAVTVPGYSFSSAMRTITQPWRLGYPKSPPPDMGNCLQHYEQMESWLNASFTNLEKQRFGAHSADLQEFETSYAKHKSDFDRRITETSKATNECLAAKSSLGAEMAIIQTQLSAFSGRIQSLESRLQSLPPSSSPGHKPLNFLSTHLGASVIPSLTSPTVGKGKGLFQRLLSQILVSQLAYPPSEALRGWNEAGQCWCGAGPAISLGIRLPTVVAPKVFRVEHVPAQGAVDAGSQPRKVEVWARLADEVLRVDARPALAVRGNAACTSGETPGLQSDWHCLGTMEMAGGAEVSWLAVREEMEITDVVVKVTANHGNAEMTCLYRVTMEGEWVRSEDE